MSADAYAKGAQWLDALPEQDHFWRKALLTNKDGKPINAVANVITALSGAPALKGLVALDQFAGQIKVMRFPPWESDPVPRTWTDADDVSLQNWMQCEGLPIASVLTVNNGVQVIAKRNQFDPLSEYLNGLKWDGVERIDWWLHDYLNAEQSDIYREFGRRFLISAVARALQPGCKADHVLVLEGEQGIYKSEAVAALGGEWTQDDLPDLHSKDSAIALAGKWFIELSELSAMNRSEVEHVKKFITMKSDKYRPPYGRNAIEVPRRCIFIATTNESRYLRDHTGNRRFWPVKCGRIHIDDLRTDRDLLLAEAVEAYRNGEQWHITDDRLLGDAQAAQAARMEVDPWYEIIATEAAHRDTVTNRHLMQILGIPAERQSGGHAKRIGTVMRALKWVDKVDQSGGKRDVVWERGSK